MAAEVHPAFSAEVRHLEGTEEVIARERAAAETELESATEKLDQARRFDPDGLPMAEMLFTHSRQTLVNLGAAAGKPYFTRIDFTEKDGQENTYYIGKYGVLRSDTLESEVVDWRAPVANLYYSGQIGPMKYSAPDGEVEGDYSAAGPLVRAPSRSWESKKQK